MIRIVPLLLLFVVFGCAKDEVRNDIGGVVVSDVIDIGQVRVKESPVKTSFTITNRSTAAIEIDEVLSGCGCTVIELPQRIIRPSKSMEVPVKIDLFGRKGDFNTDLLVRSAAGESWRILITGKVIEDIWYDGQSIRFYIGLEQEVVSKDFTISTIDYPDIQFEFETNDSGLHLSELTRSTKDGETKILFRLTVHNANFFRTSSRIDLIPANVDSPMLTIPVYFQHLLGEQKQLLATSQINLSEIKRNENITVKVYGNRTFLRNVHKISAVSPDDAMTMVSHAMPTLDSDHLELILVFNENCQGLFRGSLVLFSHDDAATVQVSGIVVEE